MATINVSTDAELATALNTTAAAGDVIELAAGATFAASGTYFTSGRNFGSNEANQVIIKSADPNDRAIIVRIGFRDWIGLAFEDINFFGNKTVQPGFGDETGATIYLKDCTNIRVGGA